jgi:hypothetical protein
MVSYIRSNHGGLELQRVEPVVKLAVVRSGIKMRASRTYLSKNCPSNWTNAAANTPSPWGSRGPQLSTMLMRHAGTLEGETERWEKLSSQGQGVREFRGVNIGNA